MAKKYGINDKWSDLSAENIIEVTSDEGSVTGVTVNGSPYGGGGGVDIPVVYASWDDDTSTYSYTCTWTFATLSAYINDSDSDGSCAGILYDDSMPPKWCTGGKWETDANSLKFDSSFTNIYYHTDGTIDETPA